jgi:PAS domain S-box-containing protein
MPAPVRSTEERFRIAVEWAPCAMLMVNEQGRILLVNAQAEELFGYSSKNLVDEPIEILVPETIRGSHSILRESFSSKPKMRALGSGRDFYARRKDGSLFPAEIGLNPIQTGEAPVFLVSIVDVSARKRIESQLRESEERFRIMADTSPVMIWVAGTDKLCNFFNKGWLDFTGRTLEQEAGFGWAEGVHPDDLKRCVETYETAFDARRRFQMEYRLRRHDGEYRWIIDTGVPRFGPAALFEGYIGTCIEVSDFKEEQEKQLALQKLESLRILAAGLAHDFANMQSGIIVLSEGLLENELDSSIAEEIQTIRKIALNGSELVQQLMMYAGADDVHVEPVNLTALIESMLDHVKLSISKRVLLRTNLNPNLPPIQSNAMHLRQLVMNLILNASEAIGENSGMIEVTTSLFKPSETHAGDYLAHLQGAEYVRLAVSDSGCGIREEIRRKIFDPFFSTKVKGRGLGLAIVQGIVRRYGAVLDFKSTPGVGTRFEILFPFTGRGKTHQS